MTDETEPTRSTGHPAVDEVLRSLQDLDTRPVSEQVAVFEDAHQGLRAALDDPGPGAEQPDLGHHEEPDEDPEDQSAGDQL